MHPCPIGNGTVSPRIPREFASLMDALQLEGANTDGLLGLDDSAWRRLLEFCDLAHLTLPLSQVTLNGMPGWVVGRLEQNVSDNARRFEKVRAAYLEASAALTSASVPHLVLKGFTQAPDYVQDPHLRMQSDIDLFCPHEQIPAAQIALGHIGYAEARGPDYSRADHVPTLSRPGNWKWRGNCFDPDMPPSIELHFCLWNDAVSMIQIPEVAQFWGRREVRRLAGFELCALSPVDHLGYLALHILRGVIAGDWVVHHALELATFLHRRARDVEFWGQWHDTHSNNLRRLEALVFCLARAWFSCAFADVVRVEVERLPLAQQHWIAHFGGAPLEVMFRRNKDGRLLQLLLTNSLGVRRTVLRRTIIPERVAGPSAWMVRTRYRRPIASADTNLGLIYLYYLASRTAANLMANTAFLFHGISLWISTRALSRQFWLFFAASFFFDLGLSIYFFFFNLFLNSHGYAEDQLGVLTAAMAVGSLAGALPAGALIQAAGLRKSVILCLTAAPVLLCARALSTAYPLQIGFAFAVGVAMSLWAVCISPMIAGMTTERERPRAFSLIFSMGIGVGAIGAFAGSRMPGWFSHPTSPPLGLAADQLTLIAASLLAALGLIPAFALQTSRTSPQARPRLFSSPALRRFLPAVATWGLVTGSFSPFANVYFATHMQLPVRTVGTVYSLSQLLQVAAVLCAPLVFRKVGMPVGVFAMQIVTAACFVLLAFSNHPVAASVTYIALSAAQYMSEPGIYSLMMGIVPEELRGGASASMALVMGASQLIAAATAGWAFTNFGYPRVLGFIAFIAVSAGLLFRTIGRPERRTLIPQPVEAPGD